MRRTPPLAEAANERWSTDIVADELAGCQRLRIPTVVDREKKKPEALDHRTGSPRASERYHFQGRVCCSRHNIGSGLLLGAGHSTMLVHDDHASKKVHEEPESLLFIWSLRNRGRIAGLCVSEIQPFSRTNTPPHRNVE